MSVKAKVDGLWDGRSQLLVRMEFATLFCGLADLRSTKGGRLHA